MKTNDYLLLTATSAYSFLFYQQNAGINFLIFNIILVAIFIIKDNRVLKQKKWLWAAVMALFSACFIFINSSALSIIANCFSLMLLSAFTFNPKTSSIFSFLFSLFSISSSSIWMIVDAIARNQSNSKQESERKKSYKFVAVASVIVLCILFFAMYKNANPLFAENTKWINLDFISLAWLSFTFGGLLLMYALFYHKTIPVIEKWEHNLSENNKENTNDNTQRFETERFSGMLLFVFLNLMLIVLNVGDITSIWFKASLPKGISHSDFVHNGVGMIILSINIATSLIMFLYRKNYTSIKYSGLLKVLIYVWIIQNLIMLFSTMCRNQIYIESFNLTYKRIGVYVWLCLAAIGLIIVLISIAKKRSNWFLVKTNFAVWFSVLTISCTVNWDLMITKYNLAHKQLNQVDFYYLFSLSDSNIPELLEITKRREFEFIQKNLKNFTDSSEYRYQQNYLTLLNQKIYRYLLDYKKDWRSFDLRDSRITKTILN